MDGRSDHPKHALAAASLPDDVARAIVRLTSLHDGDLGVIDAVVCGRRAVPALRAILFNREPSGLYETRRRAVEALAQLHADDVLIDYLSASRAIADPVERTGEEAVINAAARAVATSRDRGVVPLLLQLADRLAPLAGVVDTLGALRRIEALPYFIRALAEDFTRSAAEAAIRSLGAQTRPALLTAAGPHLAADEREPVSSTRQRRSALRLYAEFGAPPDPDWLTLCRLTEDQDEWNAVLACQIFVKYSTESAKVGAAVRRLISLLASADWPLSEEIEDSLLKHFDRAKPIIEEVLQSGTADAELGLVRARTVRALFRVAARAASNAHREANGDKPTVSSRS